MKTNLHAFSRSLCPLYRRRFVRSFCIFLLSALSVSPLMAQTFNTAAGTATWTLNGTASISEVTLTRNGTFHSDGFDNAMWVSVTGASVSFTNSYHFSSTYGAAIQHIAVTNNGATPTTFTVSSTSNLGSDSDTRYHYSSTSNGWYTVSSDKTSAIANGTDPVISLIYGNGSLSAYSPSLSFTDGSDNTSFTISNVPINPGQTRRILFVAGVGSIDDATSNRPDNALVAVQDLAAGNWPADFTSFLTNTQKAEVINWTAFSTLPVTWGDFTAQSLAANVALEWSTLAEFNTRDFVIQHCVDAQTWTNLATLPAAGQSTEPSTYTYMHTQPVAGSNYYRILQNDLDGRSSYSKSVRVVREQIREDWKVFQNPVSGGTIRLQLAAATIMRLYNMEGRLLIERKLSPGLQQIDVSQQPAGVYILRGGALTQQIVIK